jgi:hypothetical protein
MVYERASVADSFMPDTNGDTTDTDLLMALLSLQRVDGGFDLDDATLVRLGIKTVEIAKAVTGLPGEKQAALRVLHTAIVLAVLEARFADERET